MHPLLFQTDLFGLLRDPWSLHTYGLLIASGFLIALALIKRQAEREGEDPERFVDLAFYLLVAGLIGARVVFIFTKLDEFIANPIEVLMFWRGGLVWYGGFIAASGYVAYYCRRYKLPFFKFVDILVPYMALAHAFGRLGCLAAGCCFGRVTELPWGIVFPVGSMVQQAQLGAHLIASGQRALPVHPTQLYEAAGELGLFWLLILARRVKRFHGQLFLIWLGAYPALRSTIEMFRGDKERGVYILSTSQYISIGVALVAAILVGYFWRMRNKILDA